MIIRREKLYRTHSRCYRHAIEFVLVLYDQKVRLTSINIMLRTDSGTPDGFPAKKSGRHATVKTPVGCGDRSCLRRYQNFSIAPLQVPLARHLRSCLQLDAAPTAMQETVEDTGKSDVCPECKKDGNDFATRVLFEHWFVNMLTNYVRLPFVYCDPYISKDEYHKDFPIRCQ